MACLDLRKGTEYRAINRGQNKVSSKDRGYVASSKLGDTESTGSASHQIQLTGNKGGEWGRVIGIYTRDEYDCT